MVDSGFDTFVGYNALTQINSTSFCKCKQDWYGPKCGQDLDTFKEVVDECENGGVFDEGNTITGCSCRESKGGKTIPYHGWYCERDNR